MKKGLFAVLLLVVFAFPALSFSEVAIGVNIPIGGPPVYEAPGPASVFQGTVIQSYPGSLVVQTPDGRQCAFAVTPQTQVYGGLAVGSTVTVNAYPANGYWYAQSVNTIYPNYAAPEPYPVYPAPVYSEPDYYSYPYYSPGLFFGFGWGGGRHDHRFRGGWRGGERGDWRGGEQGGGGYRR